MMKAKSKIYLWIYNFEHHWIVTLSVWQNNEAFT